MIARLPKDGFCMIGVANAAFGLPMTMKREEVREALEREEREAVERERRGREGEEGRKRERGRSRAEECLKAVEAAAKSGIGADSHTHVPSTAFGLTGITSAGEIKERGRERNKKKTKIKEIEEFIVFSDILFVRFCLFLFLSAIGTFFSLVFVFFLFLAT